MHRSARKRIVQCFLMRSRGDSFHVPFKQRVVHIARLEGLKPRAVLKSRAIAVLVVFTNESFSLPAFARVSALLLP